MFKVLGNFSCNDLDKKIGEVLNDSDLSSIEEYVPFLISRKLIIEIPKENKIEEIKEIKEIKNESPEKPKRKNKG